MSLVDDAAAFKRLYEDALPRAPLLDQRQEWAVPTLEELRQALGSATLERFAGLNAIEDLTGSIVGFCALRRSKTDPLFAQVSVMFFRGSGLFDASCGRSRGLPSYRCIRE